MLAIKVQGDATLCTCCFVSFLPQSMTGVTCMVLGVWLVKALPLNESLEGLFIAPFMYVGATSHTP